MPSHVALTKRGRGRKLRPFPKGPREQMTREWKDRVKRRMVELGINRNQLAQELGVSRGAMTRLFGDQQSSALVTRISERLGLHHPLIPSTIDEPGEVKDAKIVELLREASPELKDAMILMLRAAMKKSDRK